MPHAHSTSLLSRIWKPSPSEHRKRDKSPANSGAHELFLENEGLLPPAEIPRLLPRAEISRQRDSSKPAKKVPRMDTYIPQYSATKAPANPCMSLESGGHQHERSSSALSRTTTVSPTLTDKCSENPKTSVLSFGQSVRDSKGIERGWSRVSAYPGPEPEEPPRPSTSHRLLQRLKSNSLKSQGLRTRAQLSLPSLKSQQSARNDWPYPEGHLPAPVPTFGNVPGFGYEIARPHVDLSSGAAARAAAAAQKELLEKMQRMDGLGSKVPQNDRGDIGNAGAEPDSTITEFAVSATRQDPFQVLPREIITHALGYLDAESVMIAELVSRDWHTVASSPHTWKQVFQNQFLLRDNLNSNDHGAGKPGSHRDWKAMWRVRKSLASRWLDGQAAAIYLEGHTDSVYCVQFDENKIITGSRDRTVRIWSTRTYKCLKVLGRPSRFNNTMDPLPEETIGSEKRPFARFHPPRGASPSLIDAPSVCHTGSVLCLRFDEQIMVTGSSDTTLIVWEVRPDYDYTPANRLLNHSNGVLDVSFDKKHIVSCSKDQSVCLWDRRTGDCLRKMTGHNGPVNAISLKNNLAVSVGGDTLAKIWDIQSGLCVKEFTSSKRGLACVEFSLDANTIVAGGNDKVIYEFSSDNGLVKELKGHGGLVRSVHLDNSSGHIVTGSYDMSVKVWDLPSGELIASFTKWTSSWILSTKADYRRIVATSQDSRCVIMDFGYDLPGIELLE